MYSQLKLMKSNRSQSMSQDLCQKDKFFCHDFPRTQLDFGRISWVRSLAGGDAMDQRDQGWPEEDQQPE
jgi:hypothetical protein